MNFISSLFGKKAIETIVGGFNMQYGPFKISRIEKNTTGLDREKQEKILKFNAYCTSQQQEEQPLESQQVLQKVFGTNGDYEQGLVSCMRWVQDQKTGKWVVDVNKTFTTYFDPVNHQLWTSAIVDTTPQVAQEILAAGVNIMALVETSEGVRNAKGELIPHTDNLLRLVDKLNTDRGSLGKVDFAVASYAQITNPQAEIYPQLDRGSAIIYNKYETTLRGSFVIELTSEKNKKLTVRRYPVCVFGQNGPEIVVCAAHVSGYAFKDEKVGGNPQAIKVGDNELRDLLSVLSNTLPSETTTISVNNKSYKRDDPELQNILKSQNFNPQMPIVVIGDFNQDFNKYGIEYQHQYRFPTFIPHQGSTVASDFGFQNGYSVAGKINSTTIHGATIDGFLVKNITKAELLSKPFDHANSTSDHSSVFVKF